MFITDGRKLYNLSKKYGFIYDKEYKYINLHYWKNGSGYYFSSVENEVAFKKAGYELKYVNGCFSPYVFKKD